MGPDGGIRNTVEELRQNLPPWLTRWLPTPTLPNAILLFIWTLIVVAVVGIIQGESLSFWKETVKPWLLGVHRVTGFALVLLGMGWAVTVVVLALAFIFFLLV